MYQKNNQRMHNAESVPTNQVLTQCTSKPNSKQHNFDSRATPESGLYVSSQMEQQNNKKFDEFKIIRDIDVKLNQEMKHTKRVQT